MISRKLLLCVSFVGLTSCMTPLGPSEINKLTTCRKTSLNKIKKNLMLAGYKIENMGTEDLTTDYMQVSGFGGHERYRRISVVKVDDGVFKFNVRYREVSEDRIETGSAEVEVGQTKVKNKQSQVVQRKNEQAEQYYKERYADHFQLHEEVCGS